MVVGALRRLAAVTWAGALLGLGVGGVGGRLAMLVLARLNPEVTGIISDDGFVIGRLSSQTLQLLGIATLIGVVGGGIYYVLRGLMIGPRWFQVLSVATGAAVVVGSMLVHVDGVDFTLEPVWLAIAMFVAIPFGYAALLTVLAERWLAAESLFMTAPVWLAVSPLVLWAPIAPALVVLLLVLAASASVPRTWRRQAVWPWLGRAALTVLFIVCLVDLVRDTAMLV
jgi:hypothetical protein